MLSDPVRIGPLLVLLLVAAITDIRRHRIYNWTTYPGILLGIGLNALRGWEPLADSLVGFLVCGTIMLFCFLLFNMGGGDLKLIAMIGAFLGLHDGIEAMLWTFVIGAIMGMAYLIWRIGFLNMLKKSAAHLSLVFRAKSWVPLTRAEREPLKRWLFLAPSAFLAVIMVETRGWWFF